MALPDRIPIRYLPDYRSWCIGRYADGQFLGSVVSGYSKQYWTKVRRAAFGDDWPAQQRQYSVLHLFDHDGRHRLSDIWYAGSGQGEAVDRAFARLQERVDALPAVEPTETSPFGRSMWSSTIRCSRWSMSPTKNGATGPSCIPTTGASTHHGMATTTPNRKLTLARRTPLPRPIPLGA